jgi:membrane-bound metal-dependent hydrolase YbcI (DUF457 family)
LAWPILVLLGLETVSVAPGNTAFTPLSFDSYPWSHSLLMAIVWGVVASGFMYWIGKDRRVAVLVGMVVLSHWLLDFTTHRADLALWPGGSKHGMGLWNSIPGTIVVEGSLFVAAIVMYVRAFKPCDATGKWSFWTLVGLTGAIWIMQPWSPPPPSAKAVATVAIAVFLFPLWTAWIERHRSMDGTA